MDIVEALQIRASELETELSKIRRAIVALSGATGKRRIDGSGRKMYTPKTYTHTAATRRRLSIKMKRMWAKKRRKATK